MRYQHTGELHGVLNPFVIEAETFTGEPKQEGSDNHAHTPERMDGPILYIDCTFAANGASEAFKLSRHWNIGCVRCTLLGGAEDCLDIVRGGDLFFIECVFVRGPAKQDVTLKGGARRVRFVRCPGLKRIVLGYYTKYDHHAVRPDGRRVNVSLFGPIPRPKVRDVQITPDPATGTPEVRLWHADVPIGSFTRKDWRLIVRPLFFIRATFFKEQLPPPAEEFNLDPREL